MTINIQNEKMPFSEAMTEYLITQLNKLEERYPWILQASVNFKRENDPTGNRKICKIELSKPGPNIFASTRETNFELAAKQTTRDREKQLAKTKAVLNSH
ncbi:hypothetical protein BH23BAC2_BH23BAC2_19710 [soil metagenome]